MENTTCVYFTIVIIPHQLIHVCKMYLLLVYIVYIVLTTQIFLRLVYSLNML